MEFCPDNVPLMAQDCAPPGTETAQRGAAVPQAPRGSGGLLLPWLPSFINMLIACFIGRLGYRSPIIKGLRRVRDMTRIYNLSISLDVDRLADQARCHPLWFLRSLENAPARPLRAQSLSGVSALPEIARVSPRRATPLAERETVATHGCRLKLAARDIPALFSPTFKFMPAAAKYACDVFIQPLIIRSGVPP